MHSLTSHHSLSTFWVWILQSCASAKCFERFMSVALITKSGVSCPAITDCYGNWPDEALDNGDKSDGPFLHLREQSKEEGTSGRILALSLWSTTIHPAFHLQHDLGCTFYEPLMSRQFPVTSFPLIGALTFNQSSVTSEQNEHQSLLTLRDMF